MCQGCDEDPSTHILRMSTAAESHLLQVRESLLLFSVGSERSELLAVRLIFTLRHNAADACRVLSNLGITSDPILRHNAANVFGITRGGDRRSYRPPAKPIVPGIIVEPRPGW